jgi:hypothetical protein
MLPVASAVLSGLVAFFIGLYFVWVLLWPVNPLDVYSIRVPAQQTAGETLTYSIDYCRNTDLPAVVTRSIIGADGTDYNYPYPPVGSITVQGCRSTNIVLPLNAYLPPGHYYLQVTADFDIHGSLRSVVIINRSNVFEVKAPS